MRRHTQRESKCPSWPTPKIRTTFSGVAGCDGREAYVSETQMRKLHVIKKVVFDRDKLVLHVDGQVHVFDLRRISRRLANTSPLERERFEISPSGYGIHWPLIYEDLS